MNNADTCNAIRFRHRERMAAMGAQQALDRKLESFIRENYTDWRYDADEKTRAAINAKVKDIVKKAVKGEGEPELVIFVDAIQKARAPFDEIRHRRENEMGELAKTLPGFEAVTSVDGVAALSFATMVAEIGNLDNFANVAKVWKRLGLAPYDGFAGSTWKRESWRPHKLTADEWIANPFSGRRYSHVRNIAQSIFYKQWIGASKTDDGVGKPNGPYGEIYARRRAHSMAQHPDWTKGHLHSDALRIMVKELLKQMWIEWNRGRQIGDEIQKSDMTARPASAVLKPTTKLPGGKNGRHESVEALTDYATARPASNRMKPKPPLPGASSSIGR